MNADKLSFLLEFFTRLFTSKPEFFAKLQKWVLAIAVVLLLVIAGVDWFELFDFGAKGEKLTTVLWYIVTFLGGSAVTTQVTTTKADLQDDTTKENVIKATDVNEVMAIKSKD